MSLRLALASALLLAACGAPSPSGPVYDPNTDTTRGMGDAGHLAPTDSPEACSPGLLWCVYGNPNLGACTNPASRSSCGRCQRTCAPSQVCAADDAGAYSCR